MAIILAADETAADDAAPEDKEQLPPAMGDALGIVAYHNEAVAKINENLKSQGISNVQGMAKPVLEKTLTGMLIPLPVLQANMAKLGLQPSNTDIVRLKDVQSWVNSHIITSDQNKDRFQPTVLEGIAAKLAGVVREAQTHIPAEITRIQQDPVFKKQLDKLKTSTLNAVIPGASPVRPVPIKASRETRTAQDQPENPLASPQFDSMESLRETLVSLGPKPETYSKVFALVGPDNEDSAKSALAQFFEGSPAGLCVLYDLMVQAGAASPVDQLTIGDLMEKQPQLFPDEKKDSDTSFKEEHAATKVFLRRGGSDGAYVIEFQDGRTILAGNSWDHPAVARVFGWKGGDEQAAEARAFLDANIDAESCDAFGERYRQAKAAFAGLHIPKEDAGLATMEKTASACNPNLPYTQYGPGDNRMCPKIRNVVSTFICRYHCLDGLVIDDAQVVCGEALWRGHVMDKYSKEYKDKDGKWTGGYIKKRFLVDNPDRDNSIMLKPGQREPKIRENAWSVEKRLQEMRRAEGEKRGYSPTPGDPEGLYAFDQYELMKGPKSPALFGKDKDPIAKFASKGPFNLSKTAAFDGNPMEPRSNIVGEHCPKCGKVAGHNEPVCPVCRVKFTTMYKSDADNTGGTPEKATLMSQCGVFKAVIGGRSAYAYTPEEAMAKLAQAPWPETGDTVADRAQKLTDIEQQDQAPDQPSVPLGGTFGTDQDPDQVGMPITQETAPGSSAGEAFTPRSDSSRPGAVDAIYDGTGGEAPPGTTLDEASVFEGGQEDGGRSPMSPSGDEYAGPDDVLAEQGLGDARPEVEPEEHHTDGGLLDDHLEKNRLPPKEQAEQDRHAKSLGL